MSPAPPEAQPGGVAPPAARWTQLSPAWQSTSASQSPVHAAHGAAAVQKELPPWTSAAPVPAGNAAAVSSHCNRNSLVSQRRKAKTKRPQHTQSPPSETALRKPAGSTSREQTAAAGCPTHVVMPRHVTRSARNASQRRRLPSPSLVARQAGLAVRVVVAVASASWARSSSRAERRAAVHHRLPCAVVVAVHVACSSRNAPGRRRPARLALDARQPGLAVHICVTVARAHRARRSSRAERAPTVHQHRPRPGLPNRGSACRLGTENRHQQHHLP